MLADAPAFLIAIEQSSFALAIRQSVWAYPAANTTSDRIWPTLAVM
jgi:hypothetical protein